jgi:hypothetical protein
LMIYPVAAFGVYSHRGFYPSRLRSEGSPQSPSGGSATILVAVSLCGQSARYGHPPGILSRCDLV